MTGDITCLSEVTHLAPLHSAGDNRWLELRYRGPRWAGASIPLESLHIADFSSLIWLVFFFFFFLDL